MENFKIEYNGFFGVVNLFANLFCLIAIILFIVAMYKSIGFKRYYSDFGGMLVKIALSGFAICTFWSCIDGKISTNSDIAKSLFLAILLFVAAVKHAPMTRENNRLYKKLKEKK